MRIFKFIIIMVLISALCSGCRRNRNARHGSIRTEQSVRQSNNCSYSFHSEHSNEQYSAQLLQISQSEDYDAMLSALSQGVKDVKNLRDTYFDGDMTDADLQRHLEGIREMYQPIIDALSEAQNQGRLTYRQHKKMMKLVQEYLELANETINKLSRDLFN